MQSVVETYQVLVLGHIDHAKGEQRPRQEARHLNLREENESRSDGLRTS